MKPEKREKRERGVRRVPKRSVAGRGGEDVSEGSMIPEKLVPTQKRECKSAFHWFARDLVWVEGVHEAVENEESAAAQPVV